MSRERGTHRENRDALRKARLIAENLSFRPERKGRRNRKRTNPTLIFSGTVR